MKSKYETIVKLPLFSTIDKMQWEYIFLNNECFVKDYTKGSVIHFENEKCNCIEVIMSGSVTVSKLDYFGNVMTITDIYEGDTLGSNLIFSSKPFYPMTVTAKKDTKIVALNKDIILKLCKENEGFLNKVLNIISDKTLVLTGKINAIAMKTIRQCIVDFLLTQAKIQNSNTILLPFSKKEWAQQLGIQRPSLSRELNKMRQEGIINFNNKTITIVSVKNLTHD